MHNAVRQLRGARLVLAIAQMVHRAALLEFLGAGAAYALPAKAGAESRGVPTAHSAGELAADFGVSDHVGGVRRGGGLTSLMGSPNRDRLLRTARLLQLPLGRAYRRRVAPAPQMCGAPPTSVCVIDAVQDRKLLRYMDLAYSKLRPVA